MTYLATGDFKYGMDRRRPQAVGVPGTLWLLKNAVLTRGGDIERAKKFVETHSLPENTFGLASLNGQLYVFGSAAEPAGLPNDVQYQRLLSGIPGGPPGSTYAMTRVYDARAFDGKLYVIAGYANGGVYHFYDGTKISDWTTLVESVSNHGTVAVRLSRLLNEDAAVEAKAVGDAVRVTARTAGVDFTITGAGDDNTDTPGIDLPDVTITILQANVAAVAEVRATGSVEITAGAEGVGNRIETLLVDGVDILDGHPVSWGISNDATANRLVIEINNRTATFGYEASAVGSIVTLTAVPGVGAAVNGDVVNATTSGAVTTTDTNMAGGVTAVAAVKKVALATVGSANYDGVNAWIVTINGTEYKTSGFGSATALSLFVQKQRVWCPIGSLFRYCKLNDPMDWTDPSASSGAGFINLSSQSDGALDLVGAAEYNGKCAIFSRSVIVVYTLAADAQNIAVSQTLENTGTMAARSVVTYGANDAYYLDDTGIRSLRSRDGYDAAYASDVGSAIDPFIQGLMAGTVNRDLVKAKSVIEGTDGRFFMSMGDKIIVLSYFPASKITAWSYIDFEQTIDELVRSDRDLYLRTGDTIYTYGGEDGNTYPDAGEFPVLAVTPFVSANDPAAKKQLKSYDHIASNVWRVEALVDPNDTTKTVDLGRVTGVTNNDMAAWWPGYTSLFALQYTCDSAGYASLSATANHFDTGEKQ